MMEEKLAVYRNLAKATDHLWISCAASDQQGTLTRPSAIFEKIREIFPEIQVEKDVLNRDDTMALVQSPNPTLRHLAELLREARGGTPLPEQWLPVLHWYAVHDKAKLDFIVQGISFNTKLPRVPKEQIDRLYKLEETSDLSLSPSRLERFGRCPFAHFIRYGLRPQEETLYEVGATEIGDIYHRCLMWVSTELAKDGGHWETVTKEEVEDLVARFMDRLNRKRIFYGASITVHKENLKEAFSQELLGDLSDRGCKAVFFVEYVPVDTDAEPLELDETDRAYQNIQMDAIRKRYPEMLFIAFPGDEKESGGCLAAGRGFFHINYDGSAEPCPFSPYSDANIREMTLMEAMESPFFKKLRSGDMLLADHTGGCVLFTQEDSVKELLHGETPPHRTL